MILGVISGEPWRGLPARSTEPLPPPLPPLTPEQWAAFCERKARYKRNRIAAEIASGLPKPTMPPFYPDPES